MELTITLLFNSCRGRRAWTLGVKSGHRFTYAATSFKDWRLRKQQNHVSHRYGTDTNSTTVTTILYSSHQSLKRCQEMWALSRVPRGNQGRQQKYQRQDSSWWGFPWCTSNFKWTLWLITKNKSNVSLRACYFPGSIHIYQLQPTSTYFNPLEKKIPTSTYLNLLQPNPS